MSASEEVRQALTSLFNTEFSAAQPGVEIMWENQKFVQPKGQPWVHFGIIDGDTIRSNIGPRLQVKSFGVVNVQIMVPEESGTKTLREIADSITTIFFDRQVTLPGTGSVTLYGTQRRAPRQIAGWYSVSVQTGWRAWHEITR